MFIDASAIIAIVAREVEHEMLSSKLAGAESRLISPLALYEATMGLARMAAENFDGASRSVAKFLRETNARIVIIDEPVGVAAVEAFVRFGKGRHKAKLNMGDCFSYACAKVHGVPLLFKGDDFIHTDIGVA
jgi:ribonuclease VapC